MNVLVGGVRRDYLDAKAVAHREPDDRVLERPVNTGGDNQLHFLVAPHLIDHLALGRQQDDAEDLRPPLPEPVVDVGNRRDDLEGWILLLGHPKVPAPGSSDLPFEDQFLVLLNHVLGRSVFELVPLVEQNCTIAEARECLQVVGHEQDRLSRLPSVG